jgi:gas vesicle protein
MARDDDSAAGTVIVAFVLGAVAGAAVALLMAPASGEETRRVLKDTLSSAIDRGREAYEQARTGSTGPATGGGEPL